MPGLLADLNSAFTSSNLAGAVGGQANLLAGVTHAVQSLGSGPDVLSDLQNAIHGLSLPAPLAGLGSITGVLGGVSLPSGGAGDALGGILGPLAGLSADALGHGGFIQVINVVNLLRKLVELVAGNAFSGAQGMPAPSSSGFDLDQVRASIVSTEQALDRFGATLDGPRLLGILKHTGTGWFDLQKWPTIPILTEVTEAMSTVVGWETRTPDQLTALLVETLHNTATLIATPRAWVAQPFLSAGTAAAAADTTLASAAAILDPLLATLRAKVTDTFAQPSPPELAQLDA